jgi:hypothetical protein
MDSRSRPPLACVCRFSIRIHTARDLRRCFRIPRGHQDYSSCPDYHEYYPLGSDCQEHRDWDGRWFLKRRHSAFTVTQNGICMRASGSHVSLPTKMCCICCSTMICWTVMCPRSSCGDFGLDSLVPLIRVASRMDLAVSGSSTLDESLLKSPQIVWLDVSEHSSTLLWATSSSQVSRPCKHSRVDADKPAS